MKPWYASKTLWLAAITIVLGALEAAAGVVPAEYNGAILAAIGALNMLLRVFSTSKQIGG